MSERIHDDEPDTGADVVQALLTEQCPEWSGRPIGYLATSGTDNAMWRIHLESEPDLVVRLPRRPGSAAGAEHEIALLQELEGTTLGVAIATPRVRYVGVASEIFPHPWSVLEWIEGEDAWTARSTVEPSAAALAADLAGAVTRLRQLSPPGLVERSPGSRGGPLTPLLDGLDEWLSDPVWNAQSLVDVPAVRRLVDQARELTTEPVTSSFVHGDLIPGNLLIDEGRLAAVIDWGGAGHGDPAQDLAPAWAILDGDDREIFRDAVDVDEVTWIRGRAFELEHAVGGVLYYVPRQHVLGEIMQRTLVRILDDFG